MIVNIKLLTICVYKRENGRYGCENQFIEVKV